MPLAAKHARRWIHADPPSAGKIDLGPGMELGEVVGRAFWTFERLDVGPQLNKIARYKARGEPKVPEDLHEHPGRIAARSRSNLQSFLRRLHAWLHPDHVTDCLVKGSIEIDKEVNSADGAFGQAFDIGVELGSKGFCVKIGRKLRLQFWFIRKRKLLGTGLDKKVERVDDGKLRRQIDLDLELGHSFRKHKSGLPIPMRVLLPVHK